VQLDTDLVEVVLQFFCPLFFSLEGKPHTSCAWALKAEVEASSNAVTWWKFSRE
jgi:hypothetical protein